MSKNVVFQKEALNELGLSMSLGELDFSSLGEPESNKKTEWLILRLKRFTASEVYKLMTFLDKGHAHLPAGGITYAEEVGLEAVTIEEARSGFRTKSTEWGSGTEAEACVYYMKKFGVEISNFGDGQIFMIKGEHFGCTPDGLIYNEENPEKVDEGFESKCPDSKTHVFYWRKIKNQNDLLEHKPDYYWQCMFSMFVTGARKWNWVSYDPRFINEEKKMLHIPVEWNEEHISIMRSRLTLAINVKNQIIKEFQ